MLQGMASRPDLAASLSTEADYERFEAFYLEHHDAVLAYSLRRAPPHAACDAVSETFLVAWRRFDVVPPEELPWLLGVARRVISNQRRSQARQEALALRLSRVEGESVSASLVEQSEAGPIANALTHLRPEDQEVLMLVAWEGLDHRQAAQVLGCSATAFRVRLHRAKARLRRELSNRAAPGSSADTRADRRSAPKET